jgi:hypothetical protein
MICPCFNPAAKVAGAPFPSLGSGKAFSDYRRPRFLKTLFAPACRNKFPVNRGDLLVIPIRHTPDFFSGIMPVILISTRIFARIPYGKAIPGPGQ